MQINTFLGKVVTLKDKSRVGMIDHKMQDDTAMNDVSYFCHYFFSPSLCESTCSNK